MGLKYVKIQQEVIILNSIHNKLRNQLEIVKIEEFKKSDSIQIINYASINENPIKPTS